MHPAPRELPNEPCVDGAKRQMPLLCQTPSALHMVEQPGNFGGRKIGI